MARTRMWIMEIDQYGDHPDYKFSIDDPAQIPRMGEFIDSDKAGGWVKHVQYYYNLKKGAEFDTVVNVYLGKEK